MKSLGKIVVLLVFPLWLLSNVHGQLTYPGCPNVTASDFRVIDVIKREAGSDPTLLEPIEMDFEAVTSSQGSMLVNIYFVERRGRIRKYDAATQNVVTLLSIDAVPSSNTNNNEQGVTGIALDPEFATNKWLYVYYSPLTDSVFRVSRFTVENDQLINEKIILQTPAQKQYCCHTSGSMKFDDFGHLWIGLGQNRQSSSGFINETDSLRSSESTSTSTADLRGGIIRIKPISFSDNQTPAYGLGATYTAPSGNFGEYYSNYFRNQGNNTLADEYADPAKVRPEIYVKGNRNGYTINVDPVRQWLVWGGIGPNTSSQDYEEFNLVINPAFAGWPYFAGDNIGFRGGKTAATPTNTSVWNKGVQQLPPAFGGLHTYVWPAAAMTGPIYKYDGSQTSATRLPPHFNQKWLVTDYNTSWVKVFTLDANGTAITNETEIFNTGNLQLYKPIDMEIGPDGNLYVINYAGGYSSSANTGIVRVEYTGSCQDQTVKREKVGCMDTNSPSFDPDATHNNAAVCATSVSKFLRPVDVFISSQVLHIYESGDHTIDIYNTQGRLLTRKMGRDRFSYLWSRDFKLLDKNQGVYFIKVKTEAGLVNKKIILP